MRNLIKRFVTGIITLAVMSFSAVSAFAADVETNDIAAAEEQECIALTVTSEGITSATNGNGERIGGFSISGYGYACLRPNDSGILIYPDGGGIGTMGITIKTRCETWSGYTNCFIGDSNGGVVKENYPVWSNGETYLNDIWTINPSFYLFNFRDIPQGSELHVWIWIYG